MNFKKSFLLIVSLAALSASATAQMDQAQMEKMMQGMAQMAACFENLDQEKLNALAEEGQAVEAELKQLCADGKRAQAQTKAISFGMKFMNSEEFQQVKQCGEMAQGMMPEIPDYSIYNDDPDIEDIKNRHVCDDI